MPARAGFDNTRYLAEQTAAIRERVARSGNKLYLEFGGKIMFDYHAARVLPGYDPNVKIRLLQQLRDQAELILCIHAGAIERKKIRADFGITYDADALKHLDDLRDQALQVTAVVITRYTGQPAAALFKTKLERRDVRVYTHAPTRGYPSDVDLIVSDDGYGANPYIETTRPLVVVAAPGPGSGKLATCLGQPYHEHQRGVRAGYAKFETFPIWNLPLKHPVNVAYEAATLDLKDYNLVDPFHLEAYGETTINYNRDVDAFPLLARILSRIGSDNPGYQSPTDMGVNRAGFGITDDEAVRAAARQEVIRRYFRHRCEYVMGLSDEETEHRAEMLMEELRVAATDRLVVPPARAAALEAEAKGKGNEGIYCGVAIELPDGTIVTGSNSPLLHAASALVLNAVKHLACLPHHIPVLSPATIDSIAHLKKDILRASSVSLDLQETLIALSASAMTNPTAELAMEQLHQLAGCEMHSTHMPTPGDEAGLRRLGVDLTSDPNFSSKNLFVG
ncbi:DUF1846 domain-containing protein [bacterium]|nr:DUF1846 domain-containing protein [bacterium]